MSDSTKFKGAGSARRENDDEDATPPRALDAKPRGLWQQLDGRAPEPNNPNKPRGMWDWVNARANGGGETDGSTQAIADQGVASSNASLPFREQIQTSFGEHDVSGIRAQVGGPAAQASRALGARGYASGDRVAFAEPPDLHTAAHEAAHVVQQRGGVSFKGLDGGAGDPHEQHANAVADAVVAGQSASGLLSSGPNSGSSHGAVQRQPAGGQPPPTSAPAPAKAAPAPSKPEEAYHAPSSVKDPNAPAARNADYTQIQEAAADPKAAQALDIDWIESLPAHIKTSIDASFADDIADKQIAAESKPGLAAIDKNVDAALKQLHADTAARLTKPGHKPTEKEISTDPDFLASRQQLEVDRANKKQAQVAATRAAHDAAVPASDAKQSVARADGKTVKRLEGKALARTNFMSWGIDVLGSAAAVKTHFLGIQPVKGHPDMWLAAAAKARFEAAVADFEARNPGYTFVDTSVANELRGLHQQRWGLGMLGHALGEAFDFKAIDNPNIKIDDNHNYGYLIDKFGGKDMKRGSGRATTSISEKEVESVGAKTAAGTTGPETAALTDKVTQQFEEMTQTSERLKASMAPHMAELQRARNLYFNQASLRVALSKAQAAAAHPQAAIKEALKGQTFATPADRAAAEQQVKSDLQATVEKKTQDLKLSQKDVDDTLTAVFADWTASIQADVDRDQGLLDSNQASRDQMTADEQALAALDLTGDDAMTRLDSFAGDHKLTAADKMRHKPKDAKEYRKALGSELSTRDKKAGAPLQKTDSDAHADIKELQFYQKKLMDPAFVFGKGVKLEGDNWGTKYDVSQVALMQLLEHGTVRNDPMPARTASGRQGVYNGEVVATLAKFGWAPGANFGDTMHFDFIEGYNKAVPGGRAGANMQRSHYSPEGDVVAKQAEPPKDQKKK